MPNFCGTIHSNIDEYLYKLILNVKNKSVLLLLHGSDHGSNPTELQLVDKS